ncbi:MAG: IclR family transcriptional regulator [Spirochaetia bacterium]|nr:IclR family transcriptional regulator [Spirochaetia bacterium]MCF7940605.1 IclR family transcriptional regulator [Spirochaetia bacterium]
MTKENHVPALVKAHEICCVLAEHPEGVSAARLSNELDIPKSSLHRMLNTMRDLHYIRERKAPAKGYMLGSQFMYFAQKLVEKKELQEVAVPCMQELSDLLGETVKLSITEGDHVTVLAIVEAKKPLHISVAPKAEFPLHVGAASKVLLAFNQKELMECIGTEPFKAFTTHTLTTYDALGKDLKQILTTGVGYDYEEYTEGVRAIACPIYNSISRVVGALSIPYFASISNERLLDHMKNKLKETAAAVSSGLIQQ